MRMRRTCFLASACAAFPVVLAPEVHGFGEARREAVDALVAAGTEALDRLDASLEAGDPAAVARAAVGLGPPFARLYLLLGGIRPGGP